VAAWKQKRVCCRRTSPGRAGGPKRRQPHLVLKRLVGVHQPNCQRTNENKPPLLQGMEFFRRPINILAMPITLSTLLKRFFLEQSRSSLLQVISGRLVRVIAFLMALKDWCIRHIQLLPDRQCSDLDNDWCSYNLAMVSIRPDCGL